MDNQGRDLTALHSPRERGLKEKYANVMSWLAELHSPRERGLKVASTCRMFTTEKLHSPRERGLKGLRHTKGITS